jgi:hydrogenase large subunit
MPAVIAIDPVTRLEGHLKVEVTVDGPPAGQRVVEARMMGTLFRGFEELLAGRDPWDAPYITQRVCGVCSIPHAMAAVLALDQAAGQGIPDNARILRNLVMGANFLHSHLLHFYHLALLDYVSGPDMAPWMPEWKVDRRMDPPANARLVEHYKTALRMIRLAQEMGAVFGGKLPHSPAFVPGGFTAAPTADQIRHFMKLGGELLGFIRSVYPEDVELLAAAYPEYSELGRGYGHLMALGGFESKAGGASKLFQRGLIRAGQAAVAPLEVSSITEQVTHCWYEAAPDNLPPASGQTKPAIPKAEAYSWIKAPRHQGTPFETGPLARMWINGQYRRGISTMDRHRARAAETKLIAEALLDWVQELVLGQPVFARNPTPANAQAAGLTEAPRGALGHWLRIEQGRIAHYQIITPTGWNGSPRDAAGQPGPMEQALLGVPVKDPAQPIEVLRVIHSFDPCLACAVHVMKPVARDRVRQLNFTTRGEARAG